MLEEERSDGKDKEEGRNDSRKEGKIGGGKER